jgi:hypothetical protein
MTSFHVLQVVTVLLVAVSMALALAHALELPGKLRLSRETYLAVQAIYYPGFTAGGAIGEAGGLIATLLLLVATPTGSGAFWLTLGAFVALLAMHGAYWVLTHPVNNFWLQGTNVEGFGARFFSFDPLKRRSDVGPLDWTALRDRWEHSHVVRAVLGLLSLILLAAALTVGGTAA